MPLHIGRNAMRLWTLHPRYLDSKGLVAVWREGLLAQAVLKGATKGYTHHPQLERFQAQPYPLECMAAYLMAVYREAVKRTYRFDVTRILSPENCGGITETSGQLQYEWRHLNAKLRQRAPDWFKAIRYIQAPEPHPIFQIVEGDVRKWERVKL
jgi:hypothetical protein